jgi:hypothetical protein
MHKEKGKNIQKFVEEKSETPIQGKKGKGTKRHLELKDEVFVKDFDEPVNNKEKSLSKRRSIKERVLRRLMKHTRKFLYIGKKRTRRSMLRLWMFLLPLVIRPSRDLSDNLRSQEKKWLN